MESELTQSQQPQAFRMEGGSQEQREEFHSRWVNISNINDTKIRECPYNLLRGEWQDLTQQQTPYKNDTDTPIHHITSPKTQNHDIGHEYVMTNGLRVLIRQGDLVDETTEVIVNPANSELNHGKGAARAI